MIQLMCQHEFIQIYPNPHYHNNNPHKQNREKFREGMNERHNNNGKMRPTLVVNPDRPVLLPLPLTITDPVVEFYSTDKEWTRYLSDLCRLVSIVQKKGNMMKKKRVLRFLENIKVVFEVGRRRDLKNFIFYF